MNQRMGWSHESSDCFWGASWERVCKRSELSCWKGWRRMLWKCLTTLRMRRAEFVNVCLRTVPWINFANSNVMEALSREYPWCSTIRKRRKVLITGTTARRSITIYGFQGNHPLCLANAGTRAAQCIVLTFGFLTLMKLLPELYWQVLVARDGQRRPRWCSS